jgi:glycosyltransferase involved in cell wall biosynthesis
VPANPPRVSVLLPVGNAAATIGRAVAGLRGQTAADWELLAIDDGSTDGSADRLTAAAGDDPRIRVIRQAHGGIVAALNAGLAAARGTLVARMDADDEAHPDRLAEQAAFLAAHPDVGVVGSLVAYGGNRGAHAGYALHVDWLNALVTPEAIALNRFIDAPLAHPSVMFRRELVSRHGGYRAGDFPEDFELWLRWADAGVRFAKVPRVLLTWHDPPGRLSRTDPRYAPGAFYRVKAHYLARWLAGARRDRRLLIWGAGRPTRKRAAFLEAEGCGIDGFIDIDPRKSGRVLAGRTVIAPAALPAPGSSVVLGYVANRGARELIRGELTGRGYVEGRDFLMCA